MLSFQANIYAIIITKLLGIKIIARSNTSPYGWNKSFVKQLIFKFLLKCNMIIWQNVLLPSKIYVYLFRFSKVDSFIKKNK